MKLTKFIYEHSPIVVQNLICSLYGEVEKRKRFNNQFYQYLKLYNKTQFYTAQEINEYKVDLLIKGLKHCKDHVPFYKNNIPENINNTNVFDILNKLPIINKEMIIKYSELFLSDNALKIDLQQVSTSGTTGKSLTLYRDKDTTIRQWAIWFRHRSIFNCKFGDLHVNFTGKQVVPTNQKTAPFWRFNKPMNQYLINMQHIKPENIASIVNFLNSIKPRFYSGYPSIISEISRLALENNLLLKEDTKPKYIFLGAENTLENQKDLIEKWTSAKVTDQYGLTEANCNLTKCEYDYYHEDFEFGHIECSEPELLANGDVQGKLIGTSFCNYGMPLIRYDTGDVAVWKNKKFKCPCGRNSRVISRIEGRVDDFVLLQDGRRIMRFDYLFKGTDSIQEAQVCQYELGEVVIKIVKRDDYSLTLEEKLKNSFAEWICPNTTVKFKYVQNIEKSSTGKFKAVQSFLNKD